MKRINFENWDATSADPQKQLYTGQRTAQEVFADIKYRLESQGLLPDEYFLIDDHWENGREVPKNAGLFCVADYGGSEGIYLDVYLKWRENGKPITKSFITGKTLEDTGAALDRMHLVASDIMKAVHGQRDAAPNLRLRAQDEGVSTILHLNPAEHQLLVESLVQCRESLKEDFTQTEQLLLRATGGVLEYINEVGERPLKLSAYDKAVLAIRDGDMDRFMNCLKEVQDSQYGDLLLQTAGRPGSVGKMMTVQLLLNKADFSNEEYFAAWEKAVDCGDVKRALIMASQAKDCVANLDESLFGQAISYAYVEKQKNISASMITHCTKEQIAAAPASLLYIAAMNNDDRTCFALAEKGIDGNEYAGQIIHTLAQSRNNWITERMLEKGMRFDPHNYSALQSAVNNNSLGVAKLLLENGLDFEGFQAWAEKLNQSPEHREFIQTLKAHWQQELGPVPTPAEPEQTLGGM